MVQTLLTADLGACEKWGIGATLLKADLTLLKADLGARKKRGNGAFLATDGLNATVVQGGWVTSLLKADLGARKNWGSGAAVGQRGNAWGGSDI